MLPRSPVIVSVARTLYSVRPWKGLAQEPRALSSALLAAVGREGRPAGNLLQPR